MFSAKPRLKLYRYVGLTNAGALHNSRVLALNQDNAYTKLLAADITPLKLTPLWQTQNRFTRSQQLYFFSQLAFLLQAQIPLPEALASLEQDEPSLFVKQVLHEVRLALIAGASLSAALRQLPGLCKETTLAFIQNGEHTGTLPEILEKLGHLLKAKQLRQTKLKKALSYPTFLLISSLCMLLGMIGFILPQYQDFYTDLDRPLPPLTTHLLNASHWLTAHVGCCLLVSVVFCLCLSFCLNTATCKRGIAHLILKIPGINSLIILHTLNQWCYLLALATQAGLPLLSALHLANLSVMNGALRARLQHGCVRVEAGESLHKSLANTHLFSVHVLKMIGYSESTGTTALVFSKIAREYEAKFYSKLDALMNYAEPISLAVLASLAGLLLIALYLPMLNLGLTT